MMNSPFRQESENSSHPDAPEKLSTVDLELEANVGDGFKETRSTTEMKVETSDQSSLTNEIPSSNTHSSSSISYDKCVDNCPSSTIATTTPPLLSCRSADLLKISSLENIVRTLEPPQPLVQSSSQHLVAGLTGETHVGSDNGDTDGGVGGDVDAELKVAIQRVVMLAQKRQQHTSYGRVLVSKPPPPPLLSSSSASSLSSSLPLSSSLTTSTLTPFPTSSESNVEATDLLEALDEARAALIGTQSDIRRLTIKRTDHITDEELALGLSSLEDAFEYLHEREKTPFDDIALSNVLADYKTFDAFYASLIARYHGQLSRLVLARSKAIAQAHELFDAGVSAISPSSAQAAPLSTNTIIPSTSSRPSPQPSSSPQSSTTASSLSVRKQQKRLSQLKSSLIAIDRTFIIRREELTNRFHASLELLRQEYESHSITLRRIPMLAPSFLQPVSVTVLLPSRSLPGWLFSDRREFITCRPQDISEDVLPESIKGALTDAKHRIRRLLKDHGNRYSAKRAGVSNPSMGIAGSGRGSTLSQLYDALYTTITGLTSPPSDTLRTPFPLVLTDVCATTSLSDVLFATQRRLIQLFPAWGLVAFTPRARLRLVYTPRSSQATSLEMRLSAMFNFNTSALASSYSEAHLPSGVPGHEDHALAKYGGSMDQHHDASAWADTSEWHHGHSSLPGRPGAHGIRSLASDLAFEVKEGMIGMGRNVYQGVTGAIKAFGHRAVQAMTMPAQSYHWEVYQNKRMLEEYERAHAKKQTEELERRKEEDKRVGDDISADQLVLCKDDLVKTIGTFTPQSASLPNTSTTITTTTTTTTPTTSLNPMARQAGSNTHFSNNNAPSLDNKVASLNSTMVEHDSVSPHSSAIPGSAIEAVGGREFVDLTRRSSHTTTFPNKATTVASTQMAPSSPFHPHQTSPSSLVHASPSHTTKFSFGPNQGCGNSRSGNVSDVCSNSGSTNSSNTSTQSPYNSSGRATGDLIGIDSKIRVPLSGMSSAHDKTTSSMAEDIDATTSRKYSQTSHAPPLAQHSGRRSLSHTKGLYSPPVVERVIPFDPSILQTASLTTSPLSSISSSLSKSTSLSSSTSIPADPSAFASLTQPKPLNELKSFTQPTDLLSQDQSLSLGTSLPPYRILSKAEKTDEDYEKVHHKPTEDLSHAPTPDSAGWDALDLTLFELDIPHRGACIEILGGVQLAGDRPACYEYYSVPGLLHMLASVHAIDMEDDYDNCESNDEAEGDDDNDHNDVIGGPTGALTRRAVGRHLNRSRGKDGRITKQGHARLTAMQRAIAGFNDTVGLSEGKEPNPSDQWVLDDGNDSTSAPPPVQRPPSGRVGYTLSTEPRNSPATHLSTSIDGRHVGGNGGERASNRSPHPSPIQAEAFARQLANEVAYIRDDSLRWEMLRVYDDEAYMCRTCGVECLCVPCILNCHRGHDIVELPSSQVLTLEEAVRRRRQQVHGGNPQSARTTDETRSSSSSSSSSSPTTGPVLSLNPQSLLLAPSGIPSDPLLHPSLEVLSKHLPNLFAQSHCCCGDAPRICSISPYKPIPSPEALKHAIPSDASAQATSSTVSSSTPSANSSQLTYDAELARLMEMDFVDIDANLRVLRKHKGNVERACAELLNGT